MPVYHGYLPIRWTGDFPPLDWMRERASAASSFSRATATLYRIRGVGSDRTLTTGNFRRFLRNSSRRMAAKSVCPFASRPSGYKETGK